MNNFRIVFKALVSILIITLSFTSCEHDPLIAIDMDTVCFKSDVLPIFETSCALSGCHGNGSAAEGFRATNYNSIINFVTPGNPQKSKVYTVLNSIYSEKMMPPDKPLSKDQRTIIQLWILQGAENTTCSETTGIVISPPDDITAPADYTDSICFYQDVFPIIQANCATSQCHDAISHKEGINLSSYANILGKSGLVIPYNAGGSKLIRVLGNNGGEEDDDMMPPSPRSPLTSAQVELLTSWINEGALESDCQSIGCDTSRTMSYADDIWPVFNTYCASCHSGNFPSGGIKLTNYYEIKNIVDAKRNGTSVLLGSIKQISGFSAMPQGSKLSDCNIAKIEKWIVNGATNN